MLFRSRADIGFLKDYIYCAQNSKISRIRIADTVGLMNPFSVSVMFENLTSLFPEMTFEFHGHNDLGMATANAVAAFVAGAEAISVTVNGLGERAGNTPLEELVMALRLSLDYDCGLKTELFNELCKYVECVLGRNICDS